MVSSARLLGELGFAQKSATPLFADNASAIDIAKFETINRRTKHIGVRYHFIRQQVKADVVSIHHLGTDADMTADIFTKPLSNNVSFDKMVI